MPPEVAERVKTGASILPGSDEYLELRKNWSNSERGALPGVDCPLCKNRGYITEIRRKNLVSVECKCMEKRRSLRQIERSGMKDLLLRHTLANFETEEEWQRKMKQSAIEFLDDDSGSWLAALGSVGAGKTHLCTAICGELLNKGEGVRYMLWRDESTKIKAVANDADEYDRLISPLKRVRVLYIDDLFKTKQGDPVRAADVNLAFELLNYRYCNKKLITVISSEKTMNDLLNIDEAVGSRIRERCGDFCMELTGNKNRRLMGP